jgi:alcohol dehydrogenase
MVSPDLLGLRKFVAPEFVFGSGALYLAGRYLKNFEASKVLLVSDEGVMKAGWTGEVMKSLEDEGIDYSVYCDVTPNPRAEEVMTGARKYMDEKCDIIVAVGGGSPIDCAKGIGIVSANRRNILEFAGIDQIKAPGPPLICIPTTAGSSADVSQFAIITDTKEQTKVSIISKALVPDVALIDPATTATMPLDLTGFTGVDAFTHAAESYVSNASSPITDMFALEAARLVSFNLFKTIKDPDNMELRSKMMLGSLDAGLAFSNASLGATHAMVHSLGGFLDLPHGECNAILLSHVVRYNYEACPDRYRKIGEAMGLSFSGLGEAEKKSAIIEAIMEFEKRAGVDKTLGQLGVTKEDIPTLARKAMEDVCIITNPRPIGIKDIEAIYEEAL